MEESLLVQIADHPEDDAPRLVLADWLMEQPDPAQAARGELIQIQCRRARLPAENPARGELKQRERELIERYGPAWLGPLVNLRHTFDRGLVRLTVYEHLADLRWLEDHPRNLWISTLGLVETSRAGFERLASVQHLTNLTTARIHSYSSAGDPENTGFTALIQSPNLGRVRALDLSRHPGLAGFQALAESPRLGRLTHLGFYFRLTLEDARVLARSPGPGRLDQLSLSGANLRVAELEALLPFVSGGALRGLDLTRNELDGSLAGVLNDWPGMPGLQRLQLPYNLLRPQGVVSLLRVSRFGALRELDLSGTDLRSDGLAALSVWPGLASLDRLALAFNNLEVEGVRTLLAAPQPPALVELDLSHNHLDPQAVELLCRDARLHRLENLCLDNNPVGDAGARVLAGCSQLERLQVLSLNETNLTDAGVLALLDSPELARMGFLDVLGNELEHEETVLRVEQRNAGWWE
jgi:uncharacterized protein (TIGR02996 family)